MAVQEPNDISHELTKTIISLQETIRNVRHTLSKDDQDLVFDPSQPIGHLLDTTPATAILSLAKPTSEHHANLTALESQLTTLQTTLQSRNQWLPPPFPTAAIPCSTDYLDLSDLRTAVGLITDIVTYSNPATQLTPQQAFAGKQWTWDPLWREFFARVHDDDDDEGEVAIYLSRWFFDVRREVWVHASMADSGLMPDEAQMRLGSWEDWGWDRSSGEWALDVSCELEEEVRREGGRLCVFASRWRERDGVWVYVGGRG